jgi:hypothetical protein
MKPLRGFSEVTVIALEDVPFRAFPPFPQLILNLPDVAISKVPSLRIRVSPATAVAKNLAKVFHGDEEVPELKSDPVGDKK